jgi:hypothetical protein
VVRVKNEPCKGRLSLYYKCGLERSSARFLIFLRYAVKVVSFPTADPNLGLPLLGLIIVLTEALLEKLSLCGVDTGLPSRQRGAEPIFRNPVIITFGPK